MTTGTVAPHRPTASSTCENPLRAPAIASRLLRWYPVGAVCWWKGGSRAVWLESSPSRSAQREVRKAWTFREIPRRGAP